MWRSLRDHAKDARQCRQRHSERGRVREKGSAGDKPNAGLTMLQENRKAAGPEKDSANKTKGAATSTWPATTSTRMSQDAAWSGG